MTSAPSPCARAPRHSGQCRAPAPPSKTISAPLTLCQSSAPSRPMSSNKPAQQTNPWHPHLVPELRAIQASVKHQPRAGGRGEPHARGALALQLPRAPPRHPREEPADAEGLDSGRQPEGAGPSLSTYPGFGHESPATKTSRDILASGHVRAGSCAYLPLHTA